ncbi:MAG: hypothetical protein A2Z37_18140 [Chloroflexi bacterium RBG_19FT_COMBO_62_14]|nr:MAG: hypothetical protein A2Z37_18140 [Chloroflexi bacterium RBG_19FT_COMBO_62_14]
MRRPNAFLIVTGLVGLVANALAISSYLFSRGQIEGWRPDPGLLLVLAFVALAYSLAFWSALVWRWTRSRAAEAPDPSSRTPAFLLNALAAFPLLALWTYLLLTTALQVEATTTQLWLISLAATWAVSPFVALGLIPVGEALGPLMTRED